MKKKGISKLRVKRETLRHLSQEQLGDAAGGMICTMQDCTYPTVSRTAPLSNCTNDCCSNGCSQC